MLVREMATLSAQKFGLTECGSRARSPTEQNKSTLVTKSISLNDRQHYVPVA